MPPLATRGDLAARADEIAGGLAMNPYYRCYETADGFLALACLNLAQRQAFLGLFGLEDATIAAPDLVPEDPTGARREAACDRVDRAGDRRRRRSRRGWRVLGAAGVPAGPVLARETVHADAQVRANGLHPGRRAAGARAR